MNPDLYITTVGGSSLWDRPDHAGYKRVFNLLSASSLPDLVSIELKRSVGACSYWVKAENWNKPRHVKEVKLSNYWSAATTEQLFLSTDFAHVTLLKSLGSPSGKRPAHAHSRQSRDQNKWDGGVTSYPVVPHPFRLFWTDLAKINTK